VEKVLGSIPSYSIFPVLDRHRSSYLHCVFVHETVLSVQDTKVCHDDVMVLPRVESHRMGKRKRDKDGR
jgi:hypothetical protein